MIKILLFFIFLSAPVYASEQIAGVYKIRFKNSFLGGREYVSENILEIVPEDEESIYFRTHLEFYNGHMCGIWGIATLEDGKYVYRHNYGEDKQCIMEIEVGETEIKLTDSTGVCRDYTCGARGGYGRHFPRNTRRDIRYMKILKASRQYQEALAAH